MTTYNSYTIVEFIHAQDNPSEKGHALRWIRAQSQAAKCTFVLSMLAADFSLGLHLVQKVELRGEELITVIKHCLDADISTLRRWLTPILRILGTDRFLLLIEELIDEHPARACRAMWWLGPQLHSLGLLDYHRTSINDLNSKFSKVDKPADLLDWAGGEYGRRK